MARITVQDCLEHVDNRFDLVLTAAQRARQISMGAEPRIPRENDKPTVIALREIAEGLVGREVLDEDDYSVEIEAESGMADIAEELAAVDEPAEDATGKPQAGEADESASTDDDDGESPAAG